METELQRTFPCLQSQEIWRLCFIANNSEKPANQAPSMSLIRPPNPTLSEFLKELPSTSNFTQPYRTPTEGSLGFQSSLHALRQLSSNKRIFLINQCSLAQVSAKATMYHCLHNHQTPARKGRISRGFWNTRCQI